MAENQKTPKTKNEVQVFNLDNLNPALLPELATFKEIQLKVVEDNPFVEIVDPASRDLAKKHRTARVSARTALQNQDKLISSKFNEAKTKAKSYIAELIAYTKPGEDEQQKEIDRDEAEIEFKRQEKARKEQKRIDDIKAVMDNYTSEWKTAFNLMVFDTIEEVGASFLESYTNFDSTVLEEFESLFPSVVEDLTQYLYDKTVSLTEAEIARIEKIRIAEESAILAKEKAELEAKQKLQAEADAKAKKEREDFEKEKAEFAEKQAEAKRKEDADLKAKQEAESKSTPIVETPSPQALYGIKSEEKALELIQNITPAETVESTEVLAPEVPTANVCTRIEEIIYPEIDPTWESIEEDFKNSGQKSYSKWLKSNFNVPTKL